jgi:hypothetical protein
MATPFPPSPRIRDILLGMLIAAVCLGLLFSASSVVKWLGAPFLIIPRALGIIGTFAPYEIVELPLGSSPTGVTFPAAESYAVYVSDLRLLEVAAVISGSAAPPWLVLQREDTGESVPVEAIDRGLSPFDEPRVPGRPIYRFTIEEPGTYAVSHPHSVSSAYLVPDRITGKESRLAVAALIQLALLAVPVLWVFLPRYMERRRRWRAHQRERRAATEHVRRRQAARRPPATPAPRDKPPV